jgi:hypothetical protein
VLLEASPGAQPSITIGQPQIPPGAQDPAMLRARGDGFPLDRTDAPAYLVRLACPAGRGKSMEQLA